MKKTIIALIFAALAIAASAQTYTVTTTKIVDDPTANEKIGISEDAINRVQRVFKTRMQVEDNLYDTIYHKTVVDQYIANLWNTHNALVNYFSEPDTITIINVDGGYYVDGDTSTQELVAEKNALIAHYNAMKAKYGEMVTYEKSFQVIKKRYLTLQDYITQIQSQ